MAANITKSSLIPHAPSPIPPTPSKKAPDTGVLVCHSQYQEEPSVSFEEARWTTLQAQASGTPPSTRDSSYTTSTIASASLSSSPSLASSMSLHDAIEASESVQVFHACTNELGQGPIQALYRELPPRGNAVYGCGGLFTLNLASLRPEIERIAMFDLSKKMQQFWEGMQKLLITPDLTVETMNKRIEPLLGLPRDREALDIEIAHGLSFLSSPERFARIRNIALTGHLSFTRLDLGNSSQFGIFLLNQKRSGAIPSLIYISNIAEITPTGAVSHTHPERYRLFARSLASIPKETPVIDAWTQDFFSFPVQKMHTTTRDFELEIASPKTYELALMSDRYKDVHSCLCHGIDPNTRNSEGMTELMKMAAFGKRHSVRALLDCRADIHAKDRNGHNALHWATLHDQNVIIRDLWERGARINEGDLQKMTPLHHAVVSAKPKAVAALRACNADINARDASGATPSMIMGTEKRFSHFSINRLRDQPVFAQIQALLLPSYVPPAPVASDSSTTTKIDGF